MLLTRTPEDARPAAPPRRVAGLVVALAVLAGVCLLSIAIGTRNISPATVWDAFAHYTGADDQVVVRDLRVPRTVLGLLAGVAFGLSGAVIQAVTRNPLADTQVLGVNSGAGLFVVFAVGVLGRTQLDQYIWFGIAGVAVALVLVYLLGSAGRGGATPIRLTLAGVALGAVLDGLATGIRLVRPRAFDYLRYWDIGTLAGRPMHVALTILPFVAVGTLLALAVAREMNAVALGDDLAKTLGARTTRTRAVALLSVMLLTAVATAAAGPISFVALAAPQLARRLTRTPGIALAPSAAMGAFLLVLSDWLAQRLFAPTQLPVGVVTVAVGGVYFVWLLIRQGRVQ